MEFKTSPGNVYMLCIVTMSSKQQKYKTCGLLPLRHLFCFCNMEVAEYWLHLTHKHILVYMTSKCVLSH